MSRWRWLAPLTGFSVVIHGHSMAPTLQAGTRCWVNHWSYLLHPPARGGLVVIRSPASAARVELKRIIGLPTETISWSSSRVQINGATLDEPYATQRPIPPGDDDMLVRELGKLEYFVAGDNRLYSQDSRSYGPVCCEMIVGKVTLPEPGRP